tara:strand:+ start:1253 stop:1426 length:174 start_codon:yes stop_codon:yes gene_type:complete
MIIVIMPSPYLKGTLGKQIKGNFTKFLIDVNGKPLKRFVIVANPDKIEKHLRKFLPN